MANDARVSAKKRPRAFRADGLPNRARDSEAVQGFERQQPIAHEHGDSVPIETRQALNTTINKDSCGIFNTHDHAAASTMKPLPRNTRGRKGATSHKQERLAMDMLNSSTHEAACTVEEWERHLEERTFDEPWPVDDDTTSGRYSDDLPPQAVGREG